MPQIRRSFPPFPANRYAGNFAPHDGCWAVAGVRKTRYRSLLQVRGHFSESAFPKKKLVGYSGRKINIIILPFFHLVSFPLSLSLSRSVFLSVCNCRSRWQRYTAGTQKEKEKAHENERKIHPHKQTTREEQKQNNNKKTYSTHCVCVLGETFFGVLPFQILIRTDVICYHYSWFFPFVLHRRWKEVGGSGEKKNISSSSS